MAHRRRSRRGFTLLEVILAMTIGLMLLGALYVAVDMLLGYAQMSRDVVEDSTLSRSLFARMDDDASHVIGLSDPARYRFAAGLDKVTAASSSTPGATPNSASSSAPSSASSSSSSSNGTSDSASSSFSPGTSSFGDTSASTNGSGATNIILPLGVEGDSETLHLFISNLPREVYASGAPLSAVGQDPSAPPAYSDLRRVSYWLAGGTDSPAGLARQDVPVVTSDDALQNLPPDLDDESPFILADEVRSLNFQYFDGTNWNDSWDSTQVGPDGVTPIGSPVAIAVTIGVAEHQNGALPAADAPLKTYRHVLVIPSANGATMLAQAASGATNTGNSTNTGQQSNQSMTNGSGVSP